MGNTEYRGKVIWFLLTSRPDLLPVDLKRQGRAEEHIALFYPRTDEERLAMLHVALKKTGITLASPDAEAVFLKHANGLSGADVEAILTRARMKKALENQRRHRCRRPGRPRSKISFHRRTPRRSNCKPSPPSWSAPARACCPTSIRNLDRGEIIRRTNELAALSRNQ